jgi:SAM-dependent methyltransferase
MSRLQDTWSTGDSYEQYVGRWSRQVARDFLPWLDVSPRSRWLDVGCGTGALSDTILQQQDPESVTGIDQSAGFIDYARKHVPDPRAHFETGDALHIQLEQKNFDAAVSGLMLNFLSHPEAAVSGMRDVVRPGGVVAAFVWDYADKMEFMRCFWDAAIHTDPSAVGLDEGRRFPLCNPAALEELFRAASLNNVNTTAIDIPTVFASFEDFWQPFMGGQGPAPTYVESLSEEQRGKLRDYLRSLCSFTPQGGISLVARAWAVRGMVG